VEDRPTCGMTFGRHEVLYSADFLLPASVYRNNKNYFYYIMVIDLVNSNNDIMPHSTGKP